MKWEYACLVKADKVYTFYGPRVQQQFTADNSVVILNHLGQDGWEVLGVDTYSYTSLLLDSRFWLKRPLSTDS